ncbi:MAG: single-stranded DNA-binding protein [Brevinematales bacterium]|nr:single-stranded DNA-binding protein [Brevinematales bacterium]
MSKLVNVVIVEGGVVREPELRYTATGSAYTRFAIAHAGFSKQEGTADQTSYFEVTAWGKIAEVCASYLKKGRKIIVSGKLRQSRWKDETGQARSRVVILAQDIKFMPQQRRSKSSFPEA